jgi:hypothetical protein
MESSTTNQSHGTTSKGVVLMAFGKPQYFHAAYNLAYSIKRFNKSVNVCVITEQKERGALYYCPELANVVDQFVNLPTENTITNKKLDPAKAKILIYDLLPYDENLFLDVDAVALKDIEPLINHLSGTGKNYQTLVIGQHNIKQGKDFKEMKWCYADVIWQHYALHEESILPAINSSLQYIKKSSECEELFKLAKQQYIFNPIPLNRLRSKWGGGQPDELYMNIALCITGIDAAINIDSVYITDKRVHDFKTIMERYYIHGYFGGTGFTPRMYVDWMDRLLKQWMKEDGMIHKYFIHRIIENKYVTGKQ